ncbi:ThiJ/PfpI family protein [Amylocystis lapponica]|nr:ThiJ/PfpI family protein [Amylocystis lapponica]
MSARKVLIILSDAHSFPVTKPDGTTTQEDTGFFLTELAKPLQKLLDAGYDVTFASPKGGRPSVDPLSESLLVYFGNWKQKQRESALVQQMESSNNLAAPRPFSSIADGELASFAGVFVPGGHAPLQDLGTDPDLGRILFHFHNNHKPTGAHSNSGSCAPPVLTTACATAVICHGPLALLSTQFAPGSPGFAYKGYKLTSWSDAEERLVEKLKGGEIPKVESTLKDAGAEMVSTVGKKAGGITVDREVVSGANPMAADGLGKQFVEMLQA